MSSDGDSYAGATASLETAKKMAREHIDEADAEHGFVCVGDLGGSLRVAAAVPLDPSVTALQFARALVDYANVLLERALSSPPAETLMQRIVQFPKPPS